MNSENIPLLPLNPHWNISRHLPDKPFILVLRPSFGSPHAVKSLGTAGRSATAIRYVPDTEKKNFSLGTGNVERLIELISNLSGNVTKIKMVAECLCNSFQKEASSFNALNIWGKWKKEKGSRHLYWGNVAWNPTVAKILSKTGLWSPNKSRHILAGPF